MQVMCALLQNLTARGALHIAILQILFHQSSLADNLPNFPTTKVSLHTVTKLFVCACMHACTCTHTRTHTPYLNPNTLHSI